jgi:hypothetical protein
MPSKLEILLAMALNDTSMRLLKTTKEAVDLENSILIRMGML